MNACRETFAPLASVVTRHAHWRLPYRPFEISTIGGIQPLALWHSWNSILLLQSLFQAGGCPCAALYATKDFSFRDLNVASKQGNG
jgi:hypothetical protein